jgi:hypothetical protein
LTTTPRPLVGPILCLDVSSTCTGWAAFQKTGHCYSFGRCKPLQKLPSVERTDRMVSNLRKIVEVCCPVATIMEWSSGKTHGRIAKASGLAVLGQSQGAVRQMLNDLHVPVVLVGENEWTRSKKKADRAKEVALLVPQYDPADDPGLDIADAIGLGLWHFGKIRERELLGRTNA